MTPHDPQVEGPILQPGAEVLTPAVVISFSLYVCATPTKGAPHCLSKELMVS